MFEKPLSQITAEDVVAFVETAPIQDEGLEFKQALDDEGRWASHGNLRTTAKQDIFRALIALANTRGALSAQRQGGRRSFGVCKTCRHHTRSDGQPYCALLQTQLSADEAGQFCDEHVVSPH